MTFAWPHALWALALLALLGAGMARAARREARQAVRLRLVAEALGAGAPTQRYLPRALLFAGVALLLVAAARPFGELPLPSGRATVILAIDVSGSMRAADMAPTRLGAAQAAAKALVAGMASGVRVGLVEFSSAATLVQPPTATREDLDAAIDALEPREATAIGAAILASLKALRPDAEFDLSIAKGPRAGGSFMQVSRPLSASAGSSAAKAPGIDKSTAIVLFTDGQNSAGPDPVEVAQIAADMGVRVYTVGLGTVEGDYVLIGGWSEHVALDEEALRDIADSTGAAYFRADSAGELLGVSSSITTTLGLERRRAELTALFAAAALLLLLAGAALSLSGFSRIA